MAKLLPYPRFRAFDSNGDPLSGGKIYTYTAGTSTPLATYTNSGGGTANANPVILDSQGYADIWLDATATYKIVIKDSADVTISTTDNVTNADGAAGAAGTFQIVTAAGTVDAITANYSPDLTLSNLVTCAFVATGANTSATPTFAPDGLTARTIVKKGGQPLVPGDIPAALAVCIVEYNSANTRWELLNPAVTETPWIVATGSADALTATYLPAIPAVYDGMILSFRAAAANATTTPTFAPSGLTARTIVKNGGSALAAGDIAGNLAEYFVRYNLANTRWELLNPSTTATLATYTATVVCGTSGTVTLNATNNKGRYLKIGTTYIGGGSLAVDSVSSPVGAMKVLLPATVAGLTGTAGDGTGSCSIDGTVAANGGISLPCLFVEGGTQLLVYPPGTTGFAGSLAASLQAGSVIYYSFAFQGTA